MREQPTVDERTFSSILASPQNNGNKAQHQSEGTTLDMCLTFATIKIFKWKWEDI
jgi:hypothetical protein